MEDSFIEKATENNLEDISVARFNLLFPLTFRISSLIIIEIAYYLYDSILFGLVLTTGIYLFGINLKLFHSEEIGTEYLFKHHDGQEGLHVKVFKLGKKLLIIFNILLIIHWFLIYNNSIRNSFFVLKVYPLFPILSIVFVFLFKTKNYSASGRHKFISVLKRILLGGIDKETRFVDIIVADVLTSYSKLFGDFWVILCMTFSFGGNLLCLSNNNNNVNTTNGEIITNNDHKGFRFCGGYYGPWIISLFIAYPYGIRMKQCLTEYFRTANNNHLLNALKYATSFPVIFLSALQNVYQRNGSNLEKELLYKYWICAVLVNTIYSFYWDISKDWNLTLLNSFWPSSSLLKFGGLRKDLHYKIKHLYYIAIVYDLALRFAWSVKLFPHLYYLNDHEIGVYFLQLLEIFRRWIWMFFRTETEWLSFSYNMKSLKDAKSLAQDRN